jgi:hypothetical protein
LEDQLQSHLIRVCSWSLHAAFYQVGTLCAFLASADKPRGIATQTQVNAAKAS